MKEFTADYQKEKTLFRAVRRQSKRFRIGLLLSILALIGALCCVFVYPGFVTGILCVVLVLAAVLLLGFALGGGRDFFMTRRDEYIRIEDDVMTYMFHPYGARKLEDQAYTEVEYVIPLDRIMEYSHDDSRFRSVLRCEYTCIEHGWTSELPDRRSRKTDPVYFGDHIRHLDELTALLKQAAEHNGY